MSRLLANSSYFLSGLVQETIAYAKTRAITILFPWEICHGFYERSVAASVCAYKRRRFSLTENRYSANHCVYAFAAFLPSSFFYFSRCTFLSLLIFLVRVPADAVCMFAYQRRSTTLRNYYFSALCARYTA